MPESENKQSGGGGGNVGTSGGAGGGQGNTTSHKELDPAAREADAIFNRPDMQALNDQGDAAIREHEAAQAQQRENYNRAQLDEAYRLAKNKSKEDGDGSDNPMGYSSDTKPTTFMTRMRNNRRALIGIGAGGGIVLSLVAGFLALIPLKLEMLIKSATEHAAEIPEYAIEHRLQYLTATYLAQRVLSASSPADVYPDSSPIKSLFKTWMASRYEDQLGIKITSNRTNSGQTATSWKIEFPGQSPIVGGGEDLPTMTKKIDSSKEMTKFIKTTAKEKTKWHQYYKRWAIRKTLMRTKGVTKWAWLLPDSWADKLDSYTAKKNDLTKRLKVRLYEATIDRVMPRMGLYLACLSDSAVCKELHAKRFGTTIESQTTPDLQTDCPAGDQACVDARSKLANEGAAGTDANAEGVKGGAKDIGEKVGEETGKFITKQLLSKVAAGIGVVDTLARIVNGLNNGNLNQIIYDRNSIMAVGYMAEIVSANDQLKAGKLNYEQLDALMTQVGDYGSSPAWQSEIGLLSTSSATASILGNQTAYAAAAEPRYERNCGSDGDKTVLGPGETVCPERKIISDKTAFTHMSWWQPFAEFSKIWVGTVGKLFDLFGKLTSVIGLDKAISAIMNATGINSLLGKAMGAMLELVFGSPISALDTGAEAGDNVLAGIKSSYYALGEAGQDTDTEGNDNGKGLGIGGGVFTPQQTATLKSQIAQENQDEWSQKSMFAKLFDLSDTRSVLAQLVLRVPTNSTELAMFPGVFRASAMGLIAPQSSAAGPTKDQFGFNFNYGFTNAQLTADPAQYTTEECSKLAKDREDSYVPGHEVSNDIPIYVYKKADPCALEKVVTATGAAMFSDGTDPNFQLDGANGGVATDQSGVDTSQNPSAAGFVWPITLANWPQRSMPIAECNLRYSDGTIHTGMDISVPMGTPVLAAADGVVTMDNASFGALNIKTAAQESGKTIYLNYQHLSKKNVSVGQTVKQGQVIGLSGNTGTVAPHLHFGVWLTNQFLGGHVSPTSTQGQFDIANMRNPKDYLPRDGRNIAECTG